MKHTRFNALLRARVLASAIGVAAVGGTSACAHDDQSRTQNVVNSGQTRSVDVALNLFGEPRAGARTVRVRSMGNGSYVCSPAGLGKSSRCYRN